MVEWVHCNSCFKRTGSGHKFMLTNCGHILCSHCCCNQDGKYNCSVCKKQCGVEYLSCNMKPEVQKFFTDPSDLIRKRIQDILQVLDFQKKQQKRLASKNQEQQSSKEMEKLVKKNKELEKKIIHLQEEIDHLKKSGRRSNFTESPALSTASSGVPHKLMSRLGLSTPNKSPPNKSPPITSPPISRSRQNDGHASGHFRTPLSQTDPARIAPGRLTPPPFGGRLSRESSPQKMPPPTRKLSPALMGSAQRKLSPVPMESSQGSPSLQFGKLSPVSMGSAQWSPTPQTENLSPVSMGSAQGTPVTQPGKFSPVSTGSAQGAPVLLPGMIGLKTSSKPTLSRLTPNLSPRQSPTSDVAAGYERILRMYRRNTYSP